jgi:Zn-dependent membrane protease YugP
MIIYIVIGIVVILLIIGLSIATYSGAQLEDTFHKYNRIPCNKKITGGQFALMIANSRMRGRVSVARTAGFLTDSYSSRSKIVVLSDSTCDVASVAALTVVAHEFGHAIQDLDHTKKFKLHKTLAKLTKSFGFFMFPLAIVGIFMFFIMPDRIDVWGSLLGLSAAILVLAIIFKLFSIPLERDASKRAIKLLKETDTFDDEELIMAKDLLKSALFTYIGDFLRAILWWTFLTKRTKLF